VASAAWKREGMTRLVFWTASAHLFCCLCLCVACLCVKIAEAYMCNGSEEPYETKPALADSTAETALDFV